MLSPIMRLEPLIVFVIKGVSDASGKPHVSLDQGLSRQHSDHGIAPRIPAFPFWTLVTVILNTTASGSVRSSPCRHTPPNARLWASRPTSSS